ncbi:MAG TPA: serine/threonine-protein kinase [Beijerinckiaceae bacterium]
MPAGDLPAGEAVGASTGASDAGSRHGPDEVERAFADLAANAPPQAVVARLDAAAPPSGAAARARFRHARGIALNRLGLYEEALGDLHEARRSYAAAGDAAGEAAAWRAVAQVHGWRGEGREAALALLRAVAGSAGEGAAFSLSLIEAGRLNLEIGRPWDARALFEQGLAAGSSLRASERLPARLALTQALVAAGDLAEARRILAGLDRDPDASPRVRFLALLETARVALRSGASPEAEALLARAAPLLPTDAQAFEHVELREVEAELAFRTGRAEAALALIRAVVARFAEDGLAGREVGARLQEAEILDRLGRGEEAERTLTAALRRAAARSLSGTADVVRERLAARDRPAGAWAPDAPPAVPPPAAGSRFVRRRPLGEGGFGSVSRAYDLETGAEVALKALRLGSLYDPAARAARLDAARLEAAAASRIRHPGVGRVYGVLEEAGGEALLVRELIEGPTLRQAMAAALGPSEKAGLLAHLAHALAAVHAAGVTHRDLKPENVVLRDGRLPVIIDFGISAVGRHAGPSALTPAYAAPEQIAGRAVDERADLYALGAIAFELLTGRLPERAPLGAAAFLARRRRARRLREELAAVLPGPAVEAVARMLDPSPRARPAAGDVALAFQAVP